MKPWIPVNLSPFKPLPTHLILNIKILGDISIDLFKAPTVAGLNHRRFGTDYNETYAPVVNFFISKLFINYQFESGLSVGQIDIKTAFLNCELEEEFYVLSLINILGHPPN